MQSALLLTEVLKEREAQIELKKLKEQAAAGQVRKLSKISIFYNKISIYFEPSRSMTLISTLTFSHIHFSHIHKFSSISELMIGMRQILAYH